jgi:hypothetical protein
MTQILCCLLLSVAPVADDAPPHVQRYLARCQEAESTAVGLPLPPAKDDMGTLDAEKIAVRKDRGVLVLEVVDADEAIVRAWHPLADSPRDRPPGEDELTFVDLWLNGIETSDLTAGMPAKLPHVFHVGGSKVFDTTCGKRSLPLLTPIDVEQYRTK